MKAPKVIEFNRPTKYTLLNVLGAGACGQTVHLKDEEMEIELVAKKYLPIFSEQDSPGAYQELLDRFKEEARILFKLNHQNIVRVFNYFDYRENKTSYILMEYVSGLDVLEYLKNNPLGADRIFEGVIDAFAHLEDNNILHRDIRPANILVSHQGVPKVIDFGFGKHLTSVDKEDAKSISLNWWCEVPPDFEENIYDLKTEIYFVGKLFEYAIRQGELSEFKYRNLVHDMCIKDRVQRVAAFTQIKRLILEGRFTELSFSHTEIAAYRNFSDGLEHVLSEVYVDAKYNNDVDVVERKLSDFFSLVMLEENIPDTTKLIRIFIFGGFKFWSNRDFEVYRLQDFLEMFKGLSVEKKSVVISNLFSRIDAIDRHYPSSPMDDEIPF